MTRRTQVLVAVAALASAGLARVVYLLNAAPEAIRGAVITADPDPAKQLPVGGAEVSLVATFAAASVRSDDTGYFHLPIPWHLRRGQRITLRFRRADYQPLDLEDVLGDRLHVARMEPVERPPAAPIHATAIGDPVVRYSTRMANEINVGSAVKTFQAVNEGGVPCQGSRPCSPDGKWKAGEGSATMDAGGSNKLHNARVSCIAGPCPFTRIAAPGVAMSEGGRVARVTAVSWSDTATFLLEAEVYRTVVNDAQRQSYPVVFDRALTFTLPPNAEGVSIEAEVDGGKIVFPLGPALYLTWADCQMLVNRDGTRVYRCELKSGYRFRDR